MERFFSLKLACFAASASIKKIFLIAIILYAGLYAQNIESSSLLRFPVWFVIEETPSLASSQNDIDEIFLSATDGIRRLTPFFIEGLVYGWSFSYVPADRTRGVSDFFEMKSIVDFEIDVESIRYTDAMVTSNSSVVESWIECDLTQRMVYERQRWHKAGYPLIGGKGDASVFGGVESIKIACEQAAKNAIRDYARAIEKNKPKEIIGTILLTDFPRYYIDAGKYVADLDFFLNVSKIVEYTTF